MHDPFGSGLVQHVAGPWNDVNFFVPTPVQHADQVAKAHLGVLGVDMAGSGSMTSERLRKAYLKCVVLWHPDKHTGNERTRALAEEKFKQAQTSYAFLQQHYSL